MKAAALALALLLAAAPAFAQEITSGPSINAPARFGGPATVAVNFGLLALGSKTVTAAVPGVRAGDAIIHGLAPNQSVVAGVVLGSADAPTDGQVRFTILTPVVLGVTVGTINIRLTWFGPQ